jgi:hypothetical protein
LEIDPRTKVLNERCRVFLDLAEILSDSVNDSKMSAITWIIIILIIVSIMVTVTEVIMRFVILSKERAHGIGGTISLATVGGSGSGGGLPSILANYNITLEDLKAWGVSLDDQERKAVCGGVDYIGNAYMGI